MYEDLFTHNRFGNKSELTFCLFDLLQPKIETSIKDLRTFAISHNFAIALSFDGILDLFEFLSLIKIVNNIVIPNASLINDIHLHKKESYFETNHFFKILVDKLIELDLLFDIFKEDNVKLDNSSKLFYIIDTTISLKMSPFRNLLLQTNFLHRDSSTPSKLYVNSNFTDFFKSTIIPSIQDSRKSIKMTLLSLKKQQESNEKLGRVAEMFVLNYERTRLTNHHSNDKIQLISDSQVNAGYDIKSFENKNSIFYGRFIEVKSFNVNISFYWSRNEIECAKALGDKYFIYLVDRSKIGNKKYSPIIYQNPYKKIYNSDLWSKEADSWRLMLID
jgi:hypothetical protein